MRTGALWILVLTVVIAQVVMATARLSRSDLSDTCGVCDLRAMRTAARGGFLPYCLDGEQQLIVTERGVSDHRGAATMTLKMRVAFITVLVLAGECALGLIQVVGASANERSLTKKEVVDLYEGKSWFWDKGVAFFAAKGQFNALSGDGSDRSTVTVEALDDGRMCFSAVWRGKSWRRFARTCFAHKIKDGQTYQRRLPKGEWYVFRHEPTQDGDQKLVPGDQTR